MAALYTGFVLMYVHGAHGHSRLVRELFLWPSIMSLGGLYVWGWQIVRHLPNTPANRRIVLGGMVLLSAVCWAIQPFHSTDVFGYINRGWQQLAYHTNPYVTTIGMLPNWKLDPMITDHWVNNPCPYGFGFAWVAKWVCALSGGSKAAALGIIKASHAVLLWLCVGLTYWVHTTLGSPKEAQTTAYLLGWHPLLLLHHVSNGHNDLWLGSLLALAMAVVVVFSPRSASRTLPKGYWWTACSALCLSVLMKLATIVMMPVLWLGWVAQRHWGKVLWALPLFAGWVMLVGWPYLQDLPHFYQAELSHNALISHGSLHSVVLFSGKELAKGWAALSHTPWNDVTSEAWLAAASPWIRYGLLALFGLGCLQVVLRLWPSARNGELRQQLLWQVALGIFASALCLVNSKFYPWYLGMVIPAAFILPAQNPIRQATIVLSLSQLLGFTVLGQARIADALAMTIAPLLLWAWWRYGREPHAVGEIRDNQSPAL